MTFGNPYVGSGGRNSRMSGPLIIKIIPEAEYEDDDELDGNDGGAAGSMIADNMNDVSAERSPRSVSVYRDRDNQNTPIEQQPHQLQGRRQAQPEGGLPAAGETTSHDNGDGGGDAGTIFGDVGNKIGKRNGTGSGKRADSDGGHGSGGDSSPCHEVVGTRTILMGSPNAVAEAKATDVLAPVDTQHVMR
jgi:hypothetical protein